MTEDKEAVRRHVEEGLRTLETTEEWTERNVLRKYPDSPFVGIMQLSKKAREYGSRYLATGNESDRAAYDAVLRILSEVTGTWLASFADGAVN